jgi:hypothetical protein
MTPLPANKALDAYFLEARSRLLDVAAVLDRIGRGAGAEQLAADPRVIKIRQAIDALRDNRGARAEMIQQIFSLDYDPSWKRPEPR